MNKIVAIGIGILGIVAALSLFGVFTPAGNSENSPAKEFKVDAFRFGYSPDTITINKGDKVRINIINTDVPHGIRIPDLGIEGENTVEFTADKAGEFTWYCLIPCGNGHMSMKGSLIVK